jgi:chaperonin GroES
MNNENMDLSMEEGPQLRDIDSINLALSLDEDKLKEIGSSCKEGFEVDLQSRSTWERDLEDWTKLAMQVREEKSFPWRGASNVKYPILSTAAMQFAARAYPSLVPQDGKVVKASTIGKDPTGEKLEKASRVSTYMSYQVLHEMDNWEEDMDKLLLMLPIVGTVFKKTFWDKSSEKIKSCLVLPKNLVVNNWASSLDEAERISEIITLSPRVFKERQLQKIFRDVDLGSPEQAPGDLLETSPYTLIEQHTYLDLDDDGYAEPYIVTFHKQSGEVLRIVDRFSAEDVKTEGEKVVKITATQFYTKFSFVPNPDGSFYSIGFGVLLGPLNESVNTLINQLVDAGTVSNLQSGFIGKGIRLKNGETGFTPGEWKPVNATGDDLRKQIVPLPAKEPSAVLFQLMNALVTSGKELASVAEIFVGKMPGQNTPATTTMASIEQGMKVFTAVYKRIYRALKTEFTRIYTLNSQYLDPNTYAAVVDVSVGPEDFNDDTYDICPGADPSSMTQTEKLMKAQGLLELLPTGMLDPVEVVKRVLEAQEQPNWEKLLSQQIQQTGQFEPPPDPKLQEMQMKSQLEQQKVQMNAQALQQKMELQARDSAVQLSMKAQSHQQDMQHKAQMANIDAATAVHKQKIFSATEQAAVNQKLVQNHQQHQQKLQQTKEQSSVQKRNSGTGKAKK